jgi:tetratricopeptide (TPR) repeat protein
MMLFAVLLAGCGRAPKATAAKTMGADADAALAIGDAHAEKGRWFSAIWAFQDALDRRPGDFTARFSVASALLRAGLHADAVAELHALLRDHPGSAEVRLGLSRAERAAGRPERALAALIGAPEPLPEEFLIERGRALHAAGRIYDARDAFRFLLDRDPRHAEAHYWLGRLLLASGRARDALDPLRTARSLNPSDADVAWALGVTLRRTGARSEEVEAALAGALRLRPAHAPALREMASLYRATGRGEKAVELLAGAIGAAPRDAAPHRELSALMRELGRVEDAEYHHGLDLLTRDQPLQAIAVFRRMAKRAPTDPEPVLMASLGFVKMNRNVEAAREVADARPRFARNDEILQRLAMLYVLTHDHTLSRRICEEWRARAPQDARPVWIMGRIAANDGRQEEAAARYEEALRLQPDLRDAKGDLARLLLDLSGPERKERARVLLEEALAATPGSGELHLQLGRARQARGDLAGASDSVMRALELDPGLVPAYTALVGLAPRLDRGSRASFYGRLLRTARERAREQEGLWRRLWEKPSDPKRSLAMGRFFREQNDLTRASYHLDTALALHPSWPPARAERTLVRRLREVE